MFQTQQQQQHQQQQLLLQQKFQSKIDELLTAFEPVSDTNNCTNSIASITEMMMESKEGEMQENTSTHCFSQSTTAATQIVIDSYVQSVQENDTAVIETIVQMTKQVLSQKSKPLSVQLRIAEFFKRCVDTWNLFLIRRMKKEIVPIIFETLKSGLTLIQMNYSNSQLPPATTDFKSLDTPSSEQTNLTCLLSECLYVWSRWFTDDKILLTAYSELVREGLPVPKAFRFFSEIDILYRDVESLQSNLITPNQYIFEDESISASEFLCEKQGKFMSSTVMRKVQFIDEKLFQIETIKGGQKSKQIDFPDFFFLQGRAEYLQIKGCKVPKTNGIDLKLSWDDQHLEKLEWRLLCKRGNENRCYSIYFASYQQAVKVKDFIHFVKGKRAVPKAKALFHQLAQKFKSTVASQIFFMLKFRQRHLNANGEVSTSCSLQVEDCFGNSVIDGRIEQFLEFHNQ